jgi:transcriptional regulator with PAS, ATPase and Fis domain
VITADREHMRFQAHRSQLIGESPVMQELRLEIEQIAQSDAKVLITGDSGVGKELVAHAIHAHSARAHRPFLAVNCGGMPETLLESEMFGHVKGSFTGAYRDRPGKLEMADSGTVFLDEVGEMTLRMQGLLLRFLEVGELQKVGSDRNVTRVNVRVIAATNRNLHELVLERAFREDLFYRLNVIHVHVPPLRDRKEDVPPLIEHFVAKFTANSRTPVRAISPEAIAVMARYSWPGNVRELVNVVERLVVTGRREVIGPDDLPSEIRSQTNGWLRPKRERRRTIADDLYDKITTEGGSFWNVVYPLYMQREITRGNVREVVRRGLEEARGNYKIVARIFNLEPHEYKRFLNFLRKHDCQLPFKDFRE